MRDRSHVPSERPGRRLKDPLDCRTSPHGSRGNPASPSRVAVAVSAPWGSSLSPAALRRTPEGGAGRDLATAHGGAGSGPAPFPVEPRRAHGVARRIVRGATSTRPTRGPRPRSTSSASRTTGCATSRPSTTARCPFRPDMIADAEVLGAGDGQGVRARRGRRPGDHVHATSTPRRPSTSGRTSRCSEGG